MCSILMAEVFGAIMSLDDNHSKACVFSSGREEPLGQRYLGSKARLADWICSILGVPATPHSRFVDLFSGTGIVSKKAAACGWTILANDHLRCAAIMTKAQLATQRSCRFTHSGGYEAVMRELNALPGVEGFIWREYSPSRKSRSGHARYYFTPDNGTRIDAIRGRIGDWKKAGGISAEEEAVLIADLLAAANRVANIAGTYGCFLKPWQLNALRPLTIVCRRLMRNYVRAEVHCADAKSIQTLPSDVAYLDPPYTKRQHAAYYHILETIALGDEPEVDGVTGLRPWRDRTSDFCYRSRAKAALRETVGRLSCGRMLVSYSSDGHLDEEDIIEVLGEIGKVMSHPARAVPRYCSNGKPGCSSLTVRELLFEVQR